jgi:ankyrin repeat protein
VYGSTVNVSPLMQALYERRQHDVDAILAGDPELDVFEAAALGRSDRVAELISADPSLARAWSPDGFTALHLAAFLGTTDTARVLLDAGADPAAVAQNDMLVQPLHSAAAAHNTDLCRLLLERGAPVNGQQQKGYTALDEAEMTNQDALRDLLLEHGADPKITGVT